MSAAAGALADGHAGGAARDVSPTTVRDGLKSRGILTAAGMGPFESAGFRIGHLGDIRAADVSRTLAALGETLRVLRGVERAAS